MGRSCPNINSVLTPTYFTVQNPVHERLEGEQLREERVQGHEERSHRFLLLGAGEAGSEQAGGALAAKGETLAG